MNEHVSVDDAVDDAIKQAEEWANDNRQIYQTAALLAAEVKRLQNALLWIRYQAALHHLGGAFEPIHMLAIANTAGDALSGRDDMPDFNTVIEAAQEKATEWAEKYAALLERPL